MEIISGQSIATTAGTVVSFTSAIAGTYRIKALIGNTGPVFIGYPGTTSLTTQNGYELTTGRDYIDVTVQNLSDLYLDVANANDGVCWHRMYGQVIGLRPPV
jgi:hypothetical protein